MADLKTDYKDDLLDTEINTKRVYNLVDQNGNIVAANVTIQDVTQYTQTGDSFGAAVINATNEEVNNKFDSDDVVDPMETTEPGFAADAYQTKLQFDEQNKDIVAANNSITAVRNSMGTQVTYSLSGTTLTIKTK